MDHQLPDNQAGNNPELGADFAGSPASQAVPFEMTTGNRRSFLAALGAGAMALGLSGSAVGGEPVKKVAANVKAKGVSSAANTKKLSPEEALVLQQRQWAAKHMNDDDKTWRQTRFNEITLAPEDRNREVENLYLAAIADPEGYKIVYPNEVDKSLQLGPEGRKSRAANCRMVVFAILKRENGKLSKIPGKTAWGALGLTEHISKVDPGNPGIYSSRALTSFTKEGAQNAVKFAEELMTKVDDSVASNK